MDELRAISTFVRVAELGSFNKVAAAQGVTQQAVSKTIRQLEQHLGIVLFHRTTRSSKLTEEGARLLANVQPNLEGLVDAIAEARNAGQEDAGLVRVTAGGAVGRKVLVPLLAQFQARYPRITVDLILEDSFTDLVAERIDIGFRAGGAPAGQLIGRRLFAVQQITCAAPAYLRAHGLPTTLDALGGHRCTGYRQPGTGRAMPWEFVVGKQALFRQMPLVLCSSDPEAEMLAVVAGMGIGQIDSISGAAALRDGSLVPLLLEHTSERMGLYLYYARRTDMPARVRRLIDFMVASLRDSPAFHLSALELKTSHNSWL
jgi:DNA-binding transcriptional LysR family regulator